MFNFKYNIRVNLRMSFKKISLILIIFFCLILGVSTVCAANETDVSPETTVEDNADTVVSNEDTLNTINTQKDPVKKVKKIKTDTDADEVMVNHGKKDYFKVEVKNDKTDKPVKNIKLNLKLVSKSKTKNYIVKTNSKGIAKFNTKNLGLGLYKVTVTSLDDKYTVKEKSKIIVSKMKTATVKINSKKTVGKKATIKSYIRKTYDDNEIKLKASQSIKIMKAKFYFKNIHTGKIVVKYDSSDFDNGRWELPDEDYSPYKYTPVKVKVWYLSAK